MMRFTDLLAVGLRNRGMTVEVITPQPMLLRNKAQPGRGIDKWLGYVDKWILFPLTLRRFVRNQRHEFGDDTYYHVCDHSNAPYLTHLPKERAAITCHDVLAIRGALGHTEAYCSASRTGVVLQRWILKHLSSAQRIACVSRRTLIQLCELSGSHHPGSGWKVVHNALNAEFKKIEKSEALRILKQNGIAIPLPFVLHVGSNLPRKNRSLLLQMSQQGDLSWTGNICFAGEPMDQLLSAEAKNFGIAGRVYSVAKPDHATLCALYSLAHALVFPSFSEGFGWPIIEAHACGVPVIASNLEPLIEVGGGAVLHSDPHDAKSFATVLRTLDDPAIRESLIKNGYKNTDRFGLMRMVDEYLELHEISKTATGCTAN